MSLHFLIDGYNVIKGVSSLKVIHPLEEARMSLVKIIQTRRFMKSRNNQATVVFDGRNNLDLCLNQNYGPIKIVFSKGESADETIKRIVQACGNPKQIIVVTDDRAIIFFTRSVGAEAMSVCEFIGKEKRQSRAEAPRQKVQEIKESQKIELSYEQQEAINQELRGMWG